MRRRVIGSRSKKKLTKCEKEAASEEDEEEQHEDEEEEVDEAKEDDEEKEGSEEMDDGETEEENIDDTTENAFEIICRSCQKMVEKDTIDSYGRMSSPPQDVGSSMSEDTGGSRPPSSDQEGASDSDTASEVTLRENVPWDLSLRNVGPCDLQDTERGRNNDTDSDINVADEHVTYENLEHSYSHVENSADGVLVRVHTPSAHKEHREPAGSVRQLKDLLRRLSPMISMAGTSDNTPEMLMFLSDTDPNFHTLQLVKAMRKSARDDLESTVQRLVQDYINASGNTIKDENPVVTVLNGLFQEGTFLKYMEKFQNTLMESSDYLHRNFDSEMASVLIEFCLSNEMFNDSAALDSSSNSSSLNSSLNQSGFLFLTPGQYDALGSTLVSKQNVSKWSDGLNQLLSVTPGEPVMQQSWPDIKKGLQNCLLLPLRQRLKHHHDLFGKALKMHSRLLSSQIQNAVTEANVNLIEVASEIWMSKKYINVIPKKSSSVELKPSLPVFRIIKILLLFQLDVPLLWVRYPEHLTVMLIERWLDFLVEKNDRADQLSSGDAVCLLDPEAYWLRHWLHPHYSRAKVFAAMARTPALLRHAIKFCLSFMDIADNALYEENKNDDTNEHEMLIGHFDQLKFVHCVCFILEILKYQEGRHLFPINLPGTDKKITVGKILNQLYLFNGSETKKNTLALSNIVHQKLKDFCHNNEPIVELLCKAELPRKYTEDLLHHRHSMDRTSVTLKLATLQVILDTAAGQRRVLLGGHDNGVSYLASNHDCNLMLDLFGRLLVEEHQMSLNYVLAFEMTTTIISHPVGRCLYAGHQTFRQTLTSVTTLYHKSLIGVLEAICEGRINVEHRHSLLCETASTAFSRGQHAEQPPSWMPPTIDHGEQEEADHLSMLSAHVVAVLCNNEHGSGALHTVLEEEPALLWLHPLDSPLLPSLPLLASCTSHRGVQAVLQHGGRHLAGALFSGQQVEHREAGLTLVAAAGAVADTRLLLQDRLGYQEELLRQQREEEGGGVLDECSLLRAHVLLRAAHLGTEHAPLPRLPPQRHLTVGEPSPDAGHRPQHRRLHLQHSGLWHFVENSRVSLHDQTWLLHCRRHYQAALAQGDGVKSAHLMDMLEWALEVYLTGTTLTAHHERPTPDTSPTHSLIDPLREESSNGLAPVKLDLARRYAAELELVSAGRWSHDRLAQLLQEAAAEASVRPEVSRAARHRRIDWLTIVLYMLSDGQRLRALQVVRLVSAAPVGRVLWPVLGSAQRIVHYTKLLLALHDQPTYNALQVYSSGCIWNLTEGWLEVCLLGVVPWQELCHWVVAVTLHGADYAIYLTVQLLKHRLHTLYTALPQLHTPSDRLLALQTEELEDWRLNDHLTAAHDLCRRHRRLLTALLTRDDC